MACGFSLLGGRAFGEIFGWAHSLNAPVHAVVVDLAGFLDDALIDAAA
jgi:hypothetical protein